MSNKESNENFHHSCGGCDFCAGDEAAIARQKQMEANWDSGFGGRVDRMLDSFGDRLETGVAKIQEIRDRKPITKAAEAIGRFDERITSAMVASSKKREIETKNRHSRTQISNGRKVAALTGVAIAAQTVAPAAMARETEDVRKPFDIGVKPKVRVFEPLDQAVLDQAAIGLTLIPEASKNTKPIGAQEKVIADEAPAESTESQVAKPETKSSIQIKIDLQGLNSAQKQALARAINKPIAAEDIEVTIDNPKISYLKEGENPKDLARNILTGEDKENRSLINGLANVIARMNDIDIEAREDRVIQPGRALYIPQQAPNIEVEMPSPDAPEVQPTQENSVMEDSEDADVLETKVSRNPKTDLDVLVESIKKFEISNAISSGASASEIPNSSPVADKLKNQSEEIVRKVESGETNIEAVQSEALVSLVSGSKDLGLEAVAEQVVQAQYDEHGITAPKEVVSSQAQEIIEGIVNSQPETQNPQVAEGAKLDTASKSLATVKLEIDTRVTEWQEKTSSAAEDLSDFGLKTKDPLKTAALITELEMSEKLRGDEYYYLLLDGNEVIENIRFVREELTNAIYQDLGASRLLDDTELKTQYIVKTADLLSESFVDLAEYITEIESDVYNQLEEGKARVVPIMAELTSVFEETNNLPDDTLVRLTAEGAMDVSDDYLKMLVLQEVADLDETPVEQLVKKYYTETFKFAGMTDVFSESQIDEFVAETIMVWSREDFESKLVELNPAEIIDATLGDGFRELLQSVEQYIESKDNIKPEDYKELVKQYLVAVDSSNLKLAFIFSITNDHEKVDEFLIDYYESNDAAYYIKDDPIIQALTEHFLANPDISPADYIEQLAGYSGNPEEIFPDGRQYVLRDYNQTDLTAFFESAGIDAKILDHPLNQHIKESDGIIVAELPYIWLEDATSVDEAVTKGLYDEIILGIRPPEPAVLPAEPEPTSEVDSELNTEERKEKAPSSITEKIEQSLDRVEIEDKVNNLDRAVEAARDWYTPEKDPHRLPETPDGYVRMPFADDLEGFNLLYTRSVKAAPVETYAAPETVAVAWGMAELWHQLIETKYPEYTGSMLRFRDFNSAHHKTHGDGRNIDVSTQLDASITEASTGPAMDFVSGDGTNNNYNFELNVDYAVAIASLKIDGKYAISSMLSSDAKLVRAVNDRLGRKVMYEYPHHGEHWHISIRKEYALANFKPVSPFEELGYKGDLGIGSEYQDVPEEMHDEEHGEVEEALEEASEETTSLREENEVVQESKSAEVNLPPGITERQLEVSQASSLEQLVEMGFTSLTKIPDEDKKKFNQVLAERPSIEYAIENYNSLEGDPRGPKLPATAVVAIAYDLGLRGEDLLETVTTVRGESVGFAPYVIGDDKGARTDDGKVIRASAGLGQFYQKNEQGLTQDELARAEVLLHPVAAMIEVLDYRERRGLKPWNFFNNRLKDIENWNAHRDKVTGALAMLGELKP